MPKGPRQKLVGLLDYVEQVVRLDERVAFRLSEYRLPDGSAFAVEPADTRSLPGIHHDSREDDGPVWLEISRLARHEPPTPPEDIAEWIVLSADPAALPTARSQRIMTVTAVERDVALSRQLVRAENVMQAPRKRDEPPDAPARYDLVFHLEDHPQIAEAIGVWIAGPWTSWATEELPRRRTIALYQQFYKVFQTVENGGNESAIELMWGIGVVHWQKDGRLIDRPLLEVRVDVEIDDMRGGLIRVRPTTAEPSFDLKPYEELGCNGLPQLSELIRRELRRVAENGGLSPFVSETFEPILSPAASRLDSDGIYAPGSTVDAKDAKRLTVSDQWVLFARPRSQHIVLQDIERLRKAAEDDSKPISGVSERLVTEPSKTASASGWSPLDHRIGASGSEGGSHEFNDTLFDVFFPKPFNDDQIEIVRRLNKAEGLVVQGPPGTGKTHTIANLICHAMATGQRVLVVSRGEPALAVLKDQLPKEVQPLAIAVLSNERQGLRQIEGAIREIQAVVEGVRPETRRSAIRRMEAEIDGLRKRVDAIDHELDCIASAHFSKVGPRGEMPAALAQRIVGERAAHAWFTDRPSTFVAETGLTEPAIASLGAARRRAGDLLDHLHVELPSPADLPTVENVLKWHEDLVRARELDEVANGGPVRSLRIAPDGADLALNLAEILHTLSTVQSAIAQAPWLAPFQRRAINGEFGAWDVLLRDRLQEWSSLEAERAKLAQRSVMFPDGFLDNDDAQAAVLRAARGERLWPIISVNKSVAKALVAAIRLDGSSIRGEDLDGWKHAAAAMEHARRGREATARWTAFAAETGAPAAPGANGGVEVAATVLRVTDAACGCKAQLSGVVSASIGLEELTDNPQLCRSLAAQIKAHASAVRLSSARENIRRAVAAFPGADRTSVAAKQFFERGIGNTGVPAQKIE